MHIGIKIALTSSSPRPSEGGGGDDPEWVPEGATHHAEFGDFGSGPEARAWTAADGIVAVTTLLGSDPNTENGLGVSEYDPLNLTVDGYVTESNVPVALIGSARTAMLAGCTYTIKTTDLDGEQDVTSFSLVSANGNAGLNGVFSTATGINRTLATSLTGFLEVEVSNIVNVGVGARNNVAVTCTDARYELAANGSSAVSGVPTVDDRPIESPLVAFGITTSLSNHRAMTSITLYDALPSTTGLSALSETGVTNTAPTDLRDGNDLTTIDLDSTATANGMTVATLQADDAEGNPFVFTLTDDDGGNFVMDGANVNTTDDLGDGTYNFTARATDPGGLFDDQVFTLNVTTA